MCVLSSICARVCVRVCACERACVSAAEDAAKVPVPDTQVTIGHRIILVNGFRVGNR